MTLPPAAAEVLFHLGPLPVTNTLINGWIGVCLVVIFVYFATKKTSRIPRGVQNFLEMIVEFIFGEVQKVTGDRERAVRFVPIVGSLFIFILISNWLGLLPGTGSIGVWEMYHGEPELIPLLRPASSDLNFTLGIAVIAVITSHVFGIRTLGASEHLSKFVNIRGIFRAFKKGPMAVVIACIEFGVGLLEIIGEVAKVLSLSLRLFGNVFAGEVLMTVMLGIFAFAVPLPFIFLELLIGLIQATVFSMLTLAYLTVATQGHGEESHEAHESTGEAHPAPVSAT